MVVFALGPAVGSGEWGSTPRGAGQRGRDEEMVVPEIAARRSRVATYSTPVDWTLKEAVRTPQFFILAATYMAHTLIAVSVSSLSVPHLTQQGIAAGAAAAIVSLDPPPPTCF